MIFNILNRKKKSVSPVIGIVLIIALVVGVVGIVYVMVIDLTEGQAELVLTDIPVFDDTTSDPDLAPDRVTFTLKNIGTEDAKNLVLTITTGGSSFEWVIDIPEAIPSGATSSLRANSAAAAEQALPGDVIIELKYNDRIVYYEMEIYQSGSSVDTFIYAQEAISYQNEGTTESSNMSSVIYALDGSTAPVVPDGTVTYDYYATGTSGAYYDALLLNFDVGAYSPAQYSATLRFYIFDGGYSVSWHHYEVLQGKYNTTHQNVSPPAAVTPWDDTLDNGPDALMIEVTLNPYEWDSGSFWMTLRLWDAKVDFVQLIITPFA